MRRKREKIILRDLGDGLILRRSTAEDTEALAAHHAVHLSGGGAREPDRGMEAWVRDLMSGRHPTFGIGDFAIVEDTRSGKIVSSSCLISQSWSYGGIALRVGRPEIVSTHPDFRRRGLVRAQFEALHEWSARRGETMMALTGIPWFYRQFGYEMAVEHGGGRTGFTSQIHPLKEGVKEPYRLRPAREADLPFIVRAYRQAEERYLLSCVRDKALWRYELKGHSEKNVNRRELCVIETAKGKPIGFLTHRGRLHGDTMTVSRYELKPGVSWLSATPSVLRYLRAIGEKYAKEQKQELRWLAFMLGAEHPIFELIPDQLPVVHKPYAWYVRVPDVPAFLKQISPVLEQRLAGSALTRHTGELKLSFYRDGVRMMFRNGRLTKAESWASSPGDFGHAAFPNLTFLQLLFGYRTVEELEYAFADCRVNGELPRLLLSALFPKQPSAVWPMG